jgi:hypothetical protein
MRSDGPGNRSFVPASLEVSEPSGGSERMNRRRFTKYVAGVLAASLPSGAYASQATTDFVADLGEKPNDLIQTEWEEVQSRYRNLLRVYGERLNAEQRHMLGSVLIGNERMLSSIRRFTTQNSDPAALTLRLAASQPLP